MTVVEVAKGGSCIIRNMETHDGIVNMIRSYCIYENGKLKQSSEDIYRTESWEYTEDGHLMFSGRLAFEGSYEVTRNEIMEYMAYRVLSLDETCRELNRKYILPIGYERNNMFLTDWSEEEFAELDFMICLICFIRKIIRRTESLLWKCNGNKRGIFNFKRKI